MSGDPEFESRLRRLLAAHEAELAPELQARLAAARRRALERGRRRRAAWPAAMAAAALVLLALALHFLRPAPVVPDTPVDFVLLMEDDPEFIAELDFYAWLETQDEAG